jgi:Serine carboxypeptidase S28
MLNMSKSSTSDHASNNGYGAVDSAPLGDQGALALTHTSSLHRRKYVNSQVIGAATLFVGIIAFAFWGTTGGGLSVASTAELVRGDKLVVGRHDEVFYGPYYFVDQLVDHTAEEGDKHFGEKWTQRYYVNSRYFGGPGFPIFLIIGGEAEATSLFYPYVYEHLAKKFKAYVIEPEHRFYGKSYPVQVLENEDMIGLLTVENAVQDALLLLDVTRRQLKCSDDKASKDYCPTMTVGASYPGFLSALLRIVHPDRVDISYASSAPLNLYSLDVSSPNLYFDLVTRVADIVSSGCAKAVKDVLLEVHRTILGSDDFLSEASKMNICADTFPEYINSKEVFAGEMMLLVGQNFAGENGTRVCL